MPEPAPSFGTAQTSTIEPTLDKPRSYSLQRTEAAIIARLFIEHDADTNASDDDGNTALHLAVKRRHNNVVRLLLGAKADMRIPDENGRTPLRLVAKAGDALLGPTARSQCLQITGEVGSKTRRPTRSEPVGDVSPLYLKRLEKPHGRHIQGRLFAAGQDTRYVLERPDGENVGFKQLVDAPSLSRPHADVRHLILPGREEESWYVAFAPNGRFLATYTFNLRGFPRWGIIRVRDSGTGALVHTITPPTATISWAFVANSKIVLAYVHGSAAEISIRMPDTDDITAIIRNVIMNVETGTIVATLATEFDPRPGTMARLSR
ncbi:hypothetical protein BJY01DRAFT_246444 [Aspergillus pseudoustus]|uniref:Ankyrin repeat-containing domain protein n=1 Tax=Aspergillus pseudoustus TaxID=1810923 RepID=A0ABR4K8U2_9EURO